MIFETIEVGSLAVNCYILSSRKQAGAIIIDPGDQADKIRRVLDKYQLKAEIVINTHGHYDHIGCDDCFGVKVYVHRLDAPLLKDAQLNLSNFLMSNYAVKSHLQTVEDGEIIAIEGIKLEVLHTPGHTPGGICLNMLEPESKILFTGDTLFYHGVGRTDFPGASHEQLIKSIKEKLLVFPDETLIYPGHGPDSTIGREKKANPFLD